MFYYVFHGYRLYYNNNNSSDSCYTLGVFETAKDVELFRKDFHDQVKENGGRNVIFRVIKGTECQMKHIEVVTTKWVLEE